jgi:type I restriction enzyme S subunit
MVRSDKGKRYFLRAAKQTTGIASINASQLRALPILTPPMSLQMRFVDGLMAIEGAARERRKHLVAVTELFYSLQHRAFRGEL